MSANGASEPTIVEGFFSKATKLDQAISPANFKLLAESSIDEQDALRVVFAALASNGFGAGIEALRRKFPLWLLR